MNILTVPIDLMGVWHIAIFIALAMSAYQISKPLGALRWLFFYVVVSALFVLEFPLLPFGDYTRAFQATAGQTLVEILVITFSIGWWKRFTTKALPYVVAFEILAVWTYGHGLMVAPSFDTAFIALCLPMLGDILGTLGMVTILFHHGTTALLMLGAYILSNTNLFTKNKSALVMLTAIGFAIWYHHHGPWLDGMDRIEHWKRYMHFWAYHPDGSLNWRSIILGMGPGSFMFCAMLVDNYKPPFFLMMHSDWLQILFELGVVGFALTVGVVIQAIQGAKSNRRLMLGIVGSILFGLFYHPLRFAPSAILIALIFRKALVVKNVDLKLPRGDCPGGCDHGDALTLRDYKREHRNACPGREGWNHNLVKFNS